MPYRDVYDCRDIECQHEHRRDQINDWCEDLVNFCLKADCVFPRKTGHKKQRPGWNEMVKPFKEDNLFWFNTWRCAGKPMAGLLFENMKNAWKQYFYAVCRVKRKEAQLRNEKLAAAVADNNSRDFFSEVKRMRSANQSRHGINGYSDPKDIANVYAKKIQ
jgi:hypothetical protein